MLKDVTSKKKTYKGKGKYVDTRQIVYKIDFKSLFFFKYVDVDPVYGALKCRGCLKCTEGKTFKSTIGYEECQRCTNCTAIGKQVDVACTTEKDAVCMDIPPKQSAPA